MSKKLYIGNLSFKTTSSDLRTAFEPHGQVDSADVVLDRDTGRSRGFGFVEMSHGSEEAIQALDSSELDGRQISVNEARPREDRRTGSFSGRRY